MSEEKLYAKRDAFELGTYYAQHILAMTGEKLHSKSDIAAELAWRDKQIDTLLAALQGEPGALSADGSLSVEDAVSGVLDLFPGADRQALRVLGMLLTKPPKEKCDE